MKIDLLETDVIKLKGQYEHLKSEMVTSGMCISDFEKQIDEGLKREK